MAVLEMPDQVYRFAGLEGNTLDLPVDSLSQLPEWLRNYHPSLYRLLFRKDVNNLDIKNGFVNFYIQNRPISLSENCLLNKSSRLRLVTSVSGG